MADPTADSAAEHSIEESAAAPREVRVLVALLPHSSRRADLIVPFWVSQEGLAERTGLDRGNLSRSLRRLVLKRWIAERRAYVEGETGARKVYFLTPAGEAAANEVRSRSGAPVMHPADLSSPEIVGREGELGRLAAWFASDQSRVMVVLGMAGIGKTSLLLTFAKTAGGRSPVFYHRVRDWSSPGHLMRDLSDFLARQQRRALTSYLDSTERAGAVPDPGLGLYHLGKDIYSTRSLLVLDDVHLGSPELLSFIGALAECATRGGGAMLVASRRAVEPFDQRAFVSGHVRELRLGGLDRRAFEEVAVRAGKLPKRVWPEGRPGDDALERMYALTGGNPLFLGLLPRQGGALDLSRPGPLSGYFSREVVGRLSRPDRRLLARLAIYRQPVPEEAFAEPGESEAVASLLDRSLVERDASNGFYQLHDLVRESVAGSTAGREAKALHKRAASYYGRLTDQMSALERLRHSVLAGRDDLFPGLLAQRWQALVRDGLARPLLEVVEQALGSGRDAYLLLVKGACLEALGRAREATGAYVEGLRGRPPLSIRLTLWGNLAHALAVTGDRPEAERACRRGLRLAGRSATAEAEETRLRVQMVLGSLQSRGLRLAESEKTDLECLRICKRLGKTLERGLCLNNLGVVRSRAGRNQDAVRAFRDSLKLLKRAGDAPAWAHVRANLGASLDALGRRIEAMAALGEGLRGAERAGDLRVVGVACEYLALAHVGRGEPELAEAYVARALASARESRNRRRLAVAELVAGMVRLFSRRGSDSIGVLRVARRAGRSLREADVEFWAGVHLAEALAGESRIAEASKVLLECRRMLPGAPSPRFGAALLAARSQVELASGRSAESRRSASAAIGLARRNRLTGPEIDWLERRTAGPGGRDPRYARRDIAPRRE